MTFGCGCGPGPIANLRGGGWGLALALLGWTCSKPLRRGLVGRHCSTGRAHVTLCSTSALFRPGTQSGPQVVQLCPSPRPLTPQQRETYLLSNKTAPQLIVHRTCIPDFTAPDMWSPNSPDLNPVDYTIWSIMLQRLYQTRVHDIDELRQRLITVWCGLEQ